MAKKLLIERITIPGMTGDRAARVLSEATALANYGLSEDAFIAAVPADLGVSGIVNMNRRIYQPAEWIPENVKLAVRAPREFVAAEREHPEGSSTLNVAARIVHVEVYDAAGKIITLEQASDGSWCLPLAEDGEKRKWPKIARARGVLAFTRTTDGTDLWVLHQGGMALGTSSRGFGLEEQIVLSPECEWTDTNADLAGQRVGLISQYELVTYDVVADPSAGTFIHTTPPQSEARRAYLSLVESGHFPPPLPAGGSIARSESMTYEELVQKFPELAKSIAEKAINEARAKNPLIARIEGLDDKKGALLATLLAGVEGQAAPDAAPPQDKELIAAIDRATEASAKNTERQTALETQVLKLTKIAEDAHVKQLEAEKKIAEKDRTSAIDKALVTAVEKLHTKIRTEVSEFVREEIDGGRVATAENVGPLVERIGKRLLKVASEGAPVNPGPPAPPSGDDTPPPPAGSTDLLDGAMTAMGGDWRKSLADALGRTTPRTPANT